MIVLGADEVVTVKGDSFQLTLSDVMVFTTGVPAEPPLGFSHRPSIKFCESLLPRANTCTCINALYLPLTLHTEDDFTHSIMCYGILNSAGYGQV